MPYSSKENTIAYLDKVTGACVYFHEKSGKLWSADRYTELGVTQPKNNK